MGGWPWPLDGVQAWFESLWNWISSAASIAVSVVSGWIWEAINLIRDKITGSVNWLRDTFGTLIQGVSSWIWEAINLIRDSVSNGLNWLSSSLGSLIQGVSSWIWEATNLIRDSVSNGLNWLSTSIGGLIQGVSGWIWEATNLVRNKIADGLKDVYSFVSNQVGSALETVKESVSGVIDAATSGIAGAIDAVVGSLTGILTGISNILALVDPAGLANSIMATLTGFSFSPEAPAIAGTAEARRIYLKNVNAWAVDLNNQIHGVATVGAVIEAASLGQVDNIIPQFMSEPKMSAFSAAAKEIWTMEFQAKMGIQANQAFLATYTPMVPAIMDAQRMLWVNAISMDQFRDVCRRWGYGALFESGYVTLTEQIPGPGDLIRFVVREVIKPGVFTEYMGFQGFSAMISEWFWEAHWILPGRGEIIDAYHRKLITAEERDTYMVLHDFKPEPRPGIRISDQAIVAGIAKRLIPRVDLRYGWEMGQISDEDLDERYEWLGYEEDAPLMADIQRSRALTEEIHKVRDEWIKDFLEGYILEETLRANLEAIGIGAVRIDYYVQYARMRREREHKKDLLAYYEDGYVKELVTDEELAVRAAEILVDPDAIQLFLDAAYVRKYKRPKVTELA